METCRVALGGWVENVVIYLPYFTFYHILLQSVHSVARIMLVKPQPAKWHAGSNNLSLVDVCCSITMLLTSYIIKIIIRRVRGPSHTTQIHTFCVTVIKPGEEISCVFGTGLQANMLQSFAFLSAFISFFRFDNVRLNIDALKSLQRSRCKKWRVTLASDRRNIKVFTGWGIYK